MEDLSYIIHLIEVSGNLKLDKAFYEEPLYKIPSEEDKKDFFDTMKDIIISYKENKEICKDISQEYLEYSIDNCDILIIIESKIQKKIMGYVVPNILGFATLNKEDKDTIFLDLVCTLKNTKGIGSVILDTIESISANEGFRYVKLSSVTSAFGFYFKKEYECNTCSLEKNNNSQQVNTNNAFQLIKEGYECNPCDMKKNMRRRKGGGKTRKPIKKKIRRSRVRKN